jgi:bifunctional non-homologous end joining protein LigD
MSDVVRILAPDYLEGLHSEPPPEKPSPMLATLTDQYFSDPEWIFERKLDGERVLASLGATEVHLHSRNGKEVSDTYPELIDALVGASDMKALRAQAQRLREKKGEKMESRRGDGAGPILVLDGEVVAFSGPVTSFSRLQQRMQIHDPEEARKSPVAVYYYLFDVLHLGGFSVTDIPQRTRKKVLEAVLSFEDPLRLTPHRNENGEAFLREACQKGWEGIIAKKADSPYRDGRSRHWLKFKCVHRQELVIGGFTDPSGTRTGFGALLVGYYDEGGETLYYAGKVGTGFDEDALTHLTKLLKSRRRKTPPFSEAKSPGALPREGVHWVTPSLVGQFGFSEWTRAGKLRHPRFLGLRRDKDPHEVVREEPQSGLGEAE